jgi:molybdopterin-guanine dinucleotide biosynthesis protein MobB
VGIIGRQGSGKTHLIERLIGEFTRRSVTVSTIKHTHHHLPAIDTPGKDSHRHTTAGASEVIVAADSGYTLLRHRPAPATFEELLAALAPVDLVLVEGFKSFEQLPRVEVYRAEASAEQAPLAASDSTVAAVATPAHTALPMLSCRRLDLDDTAAVADAVWSLTTRTTKERHVRIAS